MERKPVVTRRQRQIEELSRLKPSKSGVLEALRLTVDLNAMELDHKLRPRIIERQQAVADVEDADIEFLFQLPLCRIKNAFVRLEFSAREFPQATVALVGWSLADEKTVASLDNSGDDADLCLFVQSTIGEWTRQSTVRY
jgi:hypothetical protein